MAIGALCSSLLQGQDGSCVARANRYYQQIVLINKSDIESFEINKTDFTIPTPICKYSVKFNLKTGKTGYRFTGADKGTVYFGTFEKTTSDLGFSMYKHNVNMLVVGISEESKCILESLDKGNFVVAMQFTDGTVEIYGIENGISTGDYTYDVQGGGGGAAIVLSSADITQENYLPLIYVSGVEGGEGADFDSNFANP